MCVITWNNFFFHFVCWTTNLEIRIVVNIMISMWQKHFSLFMFFVCDVARKNMCDSISFQSPITQLPISAGGCGGCGWRGDCRTLRTSARVSSCGRSRQPTCSSRTGREPSGLAFKPGQVKHCSGWCWRVTSRDCPLSPCSDSEWFERRSCCFSSFCACVNDQAEWLFKCFQGCCGN